MGAIWTHVSGRHFSRVLFLGGARKLPRSGVRGADAHYSVICGLAHPSKLSDVRRARRVRRYKNSKTSSRQEASARRLLENPAGDLGISEKQHARLPVNLIHNQTKRILAGTLAFSCARFLLAKLFVAAFSPCALPNHSSKPRAGSGEPCLNRSDGYS